MKTIADQIKDLENTRAAKASRMEEIGQKAIEAGRSMDEEESEEFDTLEVEVKAVDADLVRFHRLEAMQAAKAQPVPVQKFAAPAVHVNKDVDEKFKGQNFTRMVIARALSRNSDGELSPSQVAQMRWGKTNPTLVQVIKAGVAGGGSGSGEWGAELVSADNRYTGDFIEYLNSKTVFNQLPLRQIPANVTIKGQDAIATGYWVGESNAIPVSAQSMSTVSLTPLKVGAISVVSNELLRDSSPAAEALVRDGLVEAAAQRIDSTFLSSTAASPGVSPAGILASPLTSLGSNGYDADAVRADVKELLKTFIDAKNAGGLYWVMNPNLALALSLMNTALGVREFDGISVMGGTFYGYPVVVGDNVGATQLILLKPSDIYSIGEMGIQVSVSREATIEQDGVPQGESEGPTAASATLSSMFQTESTAIKVVRPLNFAKRRTGAVAYIGDADYGNSSSTTA